MGDNKRRMGSVQESDWICDGNKKTKEEEEEELERTIKRID